MAFKNSYFRCNSQSSCSVLASDDFFGRSGCPNTSKYLQIGYTCTDNFGSLTSKPAWSCLAFKYLFSFLDCILFENLEYFHYAWRWTDLTIIRIIVCVWYRKYLSLRTRSYFHFLWLEMFHTATKQLYLYLFVQYIPSQENYFANKRLKMVFYTKIPIFRNILGNLII